jgi:hypothetical protein
MKVAILLLVASYIVNVFAWSSAWTYSSPATRPATAISPFRWLATSSSTEGDAFSSSVSDASDLLQKIRNMSIRSIKEELVRYKVSTTDVFEKEDLVQRLFQARRKNPTPPPTPNAKLRNTTGVRDLSKNDMIEVPLLLTSMDKTIPVPAAHMPANYNTMTPTEQPYATIQIEIPGGRTLSLLLDTACSGFVLRPEVISRYNLPKMSTPVTMTGAGGTTGTTGLSQIQSFTVKGDPQQTRFGPLPAAVQDIGALPKALDGIIGLSFLQQFVCVELNFRHGLVRFFRKTPPSNSDDDWQMIAHSEMHMLPRLGIYTIPVQLGGRGPVNMLVDSGAASTFLTWKGVQDLGLDRTSPAIQPISAMGALGSDNVAIALTHRLHVSSILQLGRTSSYPGLSLKGPRDRLPIDIGQIPVVQSLESEGCGGILGIDVLMRCGAVRFHFQSSTGRTMTLFQ